MGWAGPGGGGGSFVWILVRPACSQTLAEVHLVPLNESSSGGDKEISLTDLRGKKSCC